MTRKAKTETTSTFKKADAFLKLKVNKASGAKPLGGKNDMALHAQYAMHKALIEFARAHKKETGEDFQFNLTGTIFIPEDNAPAEVVADFV